MSSCFLLTMMDDSIDGIFETLKRYTVYCCIFLMEFVFRCALISKSAGGIGLNVHCIRATGSLIAGVCFLNVSLPKVILAD